MKKNLFALLVILFCLSNAGNAQIVITEIMYNPPESGTDSLEFLEIYNNGSADVDITGWVLQYGASSFTIPTLTVNAGKYQLFSANAAAIQNNFGLASTQWTSGALGNNGATIRLSDSQGNLMDEVVYDDVAPWPTSPDQGGTSLVLCDVNADNNQAVNWQAATTPTNLIIAGIPVFANPNAASGCTVVNQLTANDDDYTVPAEVSRLLNVQSNDLTPNGVTTFIITVPPTQGSATVTGNGITYISNPGYCGEDEFTYQICDGTDCEDASVHLNIRCYPQRSIASMTGENPDTGVADSLGKSCELQGIVYGVNFRPTNANQPALLFTIIDQNGNGIAVSSLGGTYGYTVKEKDRVTVKGVIRQFNGMTEIAPDTIIRTSENNSLLQPVIVSKLSEDTESKLVKINNLHFVDPAEWTTGMGGSGFNVRVVANTNPNDTILLRIDRDVETFNANIPNEPFNLIGLGGQFDASNPFTEGYQILPRYNPDISTLVETVTVDFSGEVTIAPNPAQDLLEIQMGTDFDYVSIIRADGRLIRTYQQPGSLQKVNVSLYPAGTYFVRFGKDGKVWSTRFVKQ